MKQYLFTVFCVLLIVQMAHSQVSGDSIRIRTGGSGSAPAYFQNDKRLRLSQIERLMKDHPLALEEIKIAKLNSEVHTVMIFAGSFMLGWALGTVIRDKQSDIKIPVIGAGLIALSVPFGLARDRHARRAIKLYN